MVAVSVTASQRRKSRSAILMARIVDDKDQRVDRSYVMAIEYAIYKFDPSQPAGHKAITGDGPLPLVVAEVLFDSLQFNDSWTVDRVGYNFRHEIKVDQPAGRRRSRFEVLYIFSTVSHDKQSIRFRLRI